MKLPTSILCGAVMVVAASSTCTAQVIQLPTFRFFTVSTTVSVPDGGSVYLGGVNRASYGTTSRGVPGLGKLPGAGRLFSNRGRGSSVSSSGASVTATIIDHAELDALVLAEAAGRRPPGAALSETDRKALFLSSHVGRPAATGLRAGAAPRESVAAIRARNAEAARVHQAEMREYWERAQRAESLARWGAARVCYDVIARRGSGPLRSRAVTRLAQLRAPAPPAAAAEQPAKQPSAGATNVPPAAAISPATKNK